MLLAVIWTAMAVISVLCALATGQVEALGAAALEGGKTAVNLCIAMGGVICLWSGVLEVMDRCGLSRGLSRLLSPLLSRLFPRAARDPEAMGALSSNVSANLLGLGNAATPMGVKAARRMARQSPGVASDELCRLVVLNTASIQLIPATVGALRAGAGSAAPFDILPAVWITSICSVAAGLLTAKLLSKLWRVREGRRL